MEKKSVNIIDARTSEQARKRVEAILKEDRRNKGSKYMRPSFSLWGFSYQERGGRKF